MTKYFFLTSSFIKKSILLLLICWYFALYSVFFLLLLYLGLALYFFRRTKVDFSGKRIVEPNIIASPVSGKFIRSFDRDGKKILELQVAPWKSFGVYLPISSEVINYKSSLEDKKGIFTVLKSKVSTEVTLQLSSFVGFITPKVFVREGDRGITGGLMGYLPFGGKVVIELPSDCNILLKSGDKVLSSRTLLASFKEN